MVASGFTGRTRPTKVKKRENIKKRTRDDVDVAKLDQAVQALVCMQRLTEDMERSKVTVYRTPSMALIKTSPTSRFPTQPSKASNRRISPS